MVIFSWDVGCSTAVFGTVVAGAGVAGAGVLSVDELLLLPDPPSLCFGVSLPPFPFSAFSLIVTVTQFAALSV